MGPPFSLLSRGRNWLDYFGDEAGLDGQPLRQNNPADYFALFRGRSLHRP
jgi:hypothetical protein